tara:strand:- start:209 stop:1282 length:1074 start_codon:yes stop_codon:yes gene_type:complete
MNNTYFNFSLLELIIISLLTSSFFTINSVPFIQKLGETFNFRDSIEKRKQKDKSLVRIGGLGIFIGFIFSFFIVVTLLNFDIRTLIPTQNLIIILICSFLILLLGLIDDIVSLSPVVRLFFQFIITSLITGSGIYLSKIDIAWLTTEIIYLPKTLGIFISTFWIVGVINAVNWLDGLDGLASGVTGLAALGLITISFQNGQYLEPLLAAGIAGSCFGFLRFNFYPAKILMGDGGSYFLGFIFAITSLLSISTETNPIGILTPIFLLLLPIGDMTIVIITRIIKGKSPFLADRGHLHHRLLKIGFSELGTVINIYGLTQLNTIFIIALASANISLYIPIIMISTTLLFFSFILGKYVL